MAAVSNVNSVIEEVEDITSDASKAAFAITSELNDQIKAAASADEGAPVVIDFADAAAVETAKVEKEQEIVDEAAAAADPAGDDASVDDGANEADDGDTQVDEGEGAAAGEDAAEEEASEDDAGSTGGGGAPATPTPS